MTKELVKNIYQRINAVMQEVSYVQKDQKKVAGQYRFVSHDSVSSALHGPMANHGIVCIPTITSIKQDGNRTEVCLTVAFVNIDNPVDRFDVNYWGYGIDTGDKGIGKAVSYAFKYALLKTFCLETGDDPDQDQNVKHEPEKGVHKKDDERLLHPSEIATFLENYVPEKQQFLEYAQFVSQVKGWTMNQTILKFMEDEKKTRNAFYSWISKQPPLPEIQIA